MADLAWLAVIVAVVGSASRLIAIAIALRGVPPEKRPAVLRALAEVFRCWRRGGATRDRDAPAAAAALRRTRRASTPPAP